MSSTESLPRVQSAKCLNEAFAWFTTARLYKEVFWILQGRNMCVKVIKEDWIFTRKNFFVTYTLSPSEKGLTVKGKNLGANSLL